MDVKEIREGAMGIWENIEAFSESMLGDGPMGIFKIARNSEPTKTMLAREKEYAVALIAEYIQSVLSTIDPEAIKREAITQFRMDELDAVMHSIDKWFEEGDSRLKDNPAARAASAREIALKAMEAIKRACADAVRKEFRVAEGGSDTIDRVCSAIMEAAHE